MPEYECRKLFVISSYVCGYVIFVFSVFVICLFSLTIWCRVIWLTFLIHIGGVINRMINIYLIVCPHSSSFCLHQQLFALIDVLVVPSFFPMQVCVWLMKISQPWRERQQNGRMEEIYGGRLVQYYSYIGKPK